MLEGMKWFGSKEERAKKNAAAQEKLAKSIADYEAAKAELAQSHQKLNDALADLTNLPDILAEDRQRREEERANKLAALKKRTHEDTN